MEYSYLHSYKTKRIDYNKLHAKILDKFKGTGESVDKLRQYQEMLVLLDEKSHSGRAMRSVCNELFNQSKNREGKSSVSKMVWAYIENIETAKLCLIREENKSEELNRKQGSIIGRGSTFVHLQLIQISVYSKFTKDDILTYEIQPSNIPPVTLQNSLNPMLNHEFTFRLENAREFSVIVKQSGIDIGEWKFPDQPGLREGEYHRLIRSENLTLEAKIKYLPKNSSGDRAEAMSQKISVDQKGVNSRKAFQNLVLFQPFMNEKSVPKERDSAPDFNDQRYRDGAGAGGAAARDGFREELGGRDGTGTGQNSSSLSILTSHVRNLYYLLVALIVAQSLFSFESSIQFIDIMLAFYVIGMLMDQSIRYYDTKQTIFIILIVAFIVCLIKGFFGVPAPSFYYNNGVKVAMSIICAILELLVIITLVLCMNNSKDVAAQRNAFFYGEEDEEGEMPQPEPEPVVETHNDEDIWEDSKY